ncbi:MAG: Gfo/Idh/MocA family oxidoreductase [Candidatus Cloacimonetes bacterium]|nr:Gfo/Idh/MocA family oxidoreductase [Candidatus Cloacimonadota bacterium]
MVKVGVIGVGHLGQHHARIFREIANCQLVGIYDQNVARAAEISERYSVKAYPSYESLLDDIEAIDIAVTTTHHYRLAKIALQKGKHLFIEKPITSNFEEAEELVNLAKETNLKIQVGHIERFNPIVLKIADEINDPMFIESHRLAPFTPRGSDVSVVLDLMIHDIDLILSFVNSNLRDIRASGVCILTPNIDIANARLEFDNGAIANVTASRVSLKRERKIRFFQKNAYLSLDFQNKKVTVLKKSKDLQKILPEILLGNRPLNTDELVDLREIDASDITKDALTLELESFVEAIANDKKPAVDGEAGMKALKIALSIMDKIQIREMKE